MVLGYMLIAVAIVLVLVAIISYLHGKFGYVFWVLFAAGWLALLGAAVIDEQNALECVQEVEGVESGEIDIPRWKER